MFQLRKERKGTSRSLGVAKINLDGSTPPRQSVSRMFGQWTNSTMNLKLPDMNISEIMTPVDDKPYFSQIYLRLKEAGAQSDQAA